MNRRALAALASLFAALALLWLAVYFFSRPKKEERRFWPAGQTAQRLRFGAVEAVRREGAWRIVRPVDYPAEPSLLQDVLDRLPKVSVSEYLSESPLKYSLFEVDQSSGLRFSAWAGGDRPVLDLWVGKSGTDYDTFYYRPADGARVFEARGLPRYLLDRKPGEWLSKLILSVESDHIRSLSVRSPKGLLSLARKDKRWLLGRAPLAPTAVQKSLQPILIALLRLEADEVVPADQAPKDAFKRPVLNIRLAYTDKDGKPQEARLTAGKKAPGEEVWLRKEGEERVVFQLGDWKLAPLHKTNRDFKSG